jgi:hypothetical protein
MVDRVVDTLIPALVLGALVLAAVLAGRFGRPAAVLLGLVSVLWILVNHPMEGGTLVPLSHGHGFTAADLGGLAGMVLAALLWVFPRTD